MVRPWFEDPSTRRFLGGPDWAERMLVLATTAVGTRFRGALCTACPRRLAYDEHGPVGYIDCGVTDRWTTCDADDAGQVIVISSIEVPAASIALAVDPARRGLGVGRAMLHALRYEADLGHVELFAAGIEPENVASLRCFEAAGFACQVERPDWENMLYSSGDGDNGLVGPSNNLAAAALSSSPAGLTVGRSACGDDSDSSTGVILCHLSIPLREADQGVEMPIAGRDRRRKPFGLRPPSARPGSAGIPVGPK